MNGGAVATVKLLREGDEKPWHKISSESLFWPEFETICPAVQDRETALREFQSDVIYNVLKKTCGLLKIEAANTDVSCISCYL